MNNKKDNLYAEIDRLKRERDAQAELLRILGVKIL